MKVACVLKSGGCFHADHVKHLQEGVQRHLPDIPFYCYSDQMLSCGVVPLRKNYPGWWSKMELFAPWTLPDDLLYFDLDTIITGDLSDIASVGVPAIMQDVYRRNGLQSSMMYIPQETKALVWNRWAKRPDDWMRRFATGGDQQFLEGTAIPWGLWQELLPGQVVSYKVEVRPENKIPVGTRVICFHGEPRPWNTPLW